ncbi:g10326 [Coccomyxa elongata]
MKGATETVDGPITPFKPGNDDQDVQKSRPKPSNGSQAGPVKGLFASPTFDNIVASSTHTKPPAHAANAQLVDAAKDRDDAANLAHIQFATPSPFPLRTKRARSATTAPQDAQLASSDSHQDLSNVEAKRPEGFSPVASFPSLDPQGVPSAAEMTIPKAQRDLFATVPNSQSARTLATATAAAPAAEGTRRPNNVVTFGELVAEGLRQQQQQPRSGAATLSDDDEDQQSDDLAAEPPSRLTLSKKDEEWLGKIVAHYTSKVS